MLIALLASLIISTEEADTFFTTPNWMPTEISSSRTPGSDDYIGNDYAIVTNRVATPWEYSETESEDWFPILGEPCWLGTLPQWDGSRWSIGSDIINTQRVDYPDSYFYAQANDDPSEGVSDPDATQLIYTGHAWIIGKTQGETRAEMDGKAVFNRSIYTEIATNVFTRINKWYGANITATMNAMLEREYYFNAGSFINDWSTAVDGPRSNKAFWFEPIGGAIHPPFVYKSPFVSPYAKYEWSNNASWRTIGSRRFVEWDNLNRVVAALDPSKDYAMSDTRDWFFTRAGILPKTGWKQWSPNVVSSTLLYSHGMQRIEDVHNASTFSTGFFDLNWKNCAWSLGGLVFGANPKQNHKFSYISELIPYSLTFGWSTPSESYSSHVYNQPSQANTLHYTNVVRSTAFNIEEEWDGNVPRRVTNKPIAQSNVMLSAIDSNIVGTGMLAATSTLTRTCYNHIRSKGVGYTSTALTWSYDHYVTTDKIYPENMETSTTNYTTIVTNYGNTANSHFLRVSNATEEDVADWSIHVPAGGTFGRDDFRQWGSEAGYTNGIVKIIGLGSSVRVDGITTKYFTISPNPPTEPLATTRFKHNQENTFQYQREFPLSELGEWSNAETRPYYPSPADGGPTAGGRINRSSLNMITTERYAKCYNEAMTEQMDEATFRGRNLRYSNIDGNIGSRLSEDSIAIRTHLDDLYSQKRGGHSVSDWQSIIPVNNTHWQEVGGVNNHYIPAGTELYGTTSLEGMWKFQSDGDVLYEVRTNGTEIVVPSCTIQYSGQYAASGTAPISYNVIKPNGDKFSCEVRKCGIIETDWKFKSMKRED